MFCSPDVVCLHSKAVVARLLRWNSLWLIPTSNTGFVSWGLFYVYKIVRSWNKHNLCFKWLTREAKKFFIFFFNIFNFFLLVPGWFWLSLRPSSHFVLKCFMVITWLPKGLLVFSSILCVSHCMIYWLSQKEFYFISTTNYVSVTASKGMYYVTFSFVFFVFHGLTYVLRHMLIFTGN